MGTCSVTQGTQCSRVTYMVGNPKRGANMYIYRYRYRYLCLYRYLHLTHFVVQQKLTQHCKASTLQ